jgi:hypothetical protein
MRHYKMVENCFSFNMRHFLINENRQKNLNATLHQPLQKKIKPGEFEDCNMKCFESGSRINQD